ncbi:MAG: hypothetical protein AAGF10_05595 [Verrucomicrobiota bacterium]
MYLPRILTPLLLLVSSTCLLLGQGTMPVTVSSVKFNKGVGDFNWSNVVIDLQVNNNPFEDSSLNPRYVDNVGVKLTLGYTIDRSEKKFFVVQSDVMIATMEVGKKRSMAFWLPYDIVQRNNLGKTPDFWVVELTVSGQAIPLQPANASSSLPNADRLQQFMSMASQQLPQTEGILVPYYLSPYQPISRDPLPFMRQGAR